MFPPRGSRVAHLLCTPCAADFPRTRNTRFTPIQTGPGHDGCTSTSSAHTVAGGDMDKTIDVETGSNGRFEDAREMAEEKMEMLRERFSAVTRRVEEFVRERPGTALIAALGAGFLVGRLIRR